jgi:hypothetical protein
MTARSSVKKVVKETTTQTVDVQSGELVSQTIVTSSIVPREPDYVKLYLEDLQRFFELNHSESKVLNGLLRYMSYNNVVVLLKPVKEMICNELQMPMNTLNKSIDNLFKQNILIRMHKSVYLIDPNLFGKGKWEDIHSIRLNITYDNTGRKMVKTDVVKGQQLELFAESK